MHLGNLLGAVLPFGRAAANNDSSLFIADLHALTSVKDAKKLREQSHELALEYFAIFGLNTPVRIYRQSDIVLTPKLNWIFANVTPYSLMLRAHSFKDSEAKNADINMGVFNYPILMAADILGSDADMVPVGKDQIQHVEMTRDIARAFNKTYKCEVFKEPVAHVEKSVETLPGIDGRKMSKSYGNFIGVFDDEKQLKKSIMAIVTDSKGVEEPKDPETCNVFSLINIFGSDKQKEEIRAKYLAGGYGYGHAKLALLEILTEWLRPYRERRLELIAKPELIEARLAQGAKEMNAIWEKKMAEVSEVVGL